jgi:hypothetical protein
VRRGRRMRHFFLHFSLPAAGRRGAGKVGWRVSKPFSARELVARVQTRLDLARVRRDADKAVREGEERFRALFEQTTGGIAQKGPDGDSSS